MDVTLLGISLDKSKISSHTPLFDTILPHK